MVVVYLIVPFFSDAVHLLFPNFIGGITCRESYLNHAICELMTYLMPQGMDSPR